MHIVSTATLTLIIEKPTYKTYPYILKILYTKYNSKVVEHLMAATQDANQKYSRESCSKNTLRENEYKHRTHEFAAASLTKSALL